MEPIEIHAKHRWPILKILFTLIATGLVFLGGVIVGKGTIHIWAAKPIATAGPLDYSSIDQVYTILNNDFDGTLDKTKLLEGAKTGLVQATGDPYTEYFDPTAAKEFDNELAGSIIGIGAELGTDKDNNIVIVSPLSGYPAEKAGLKTNDIVAAVDGKSTTGMSVGSVVNKIRGQEGTTVKLTIIRGNGQPFNVSIVRQKITIPSVKYHEDGDIGYLKISQFTAEDTVALAKKAAAEFKAKKVKGIVLDLRGDPGGYLDAAVSVSSLWLDQGKQVVSEHRGSTVIASEAATGNNILAGLPTIVLIDGGSASASEITAGALHDNGIATLVGQKSFGKGSVQKIEKLPSGAELKITIARWYTPAGKNIDKQGITPDVVVSYSDADVKAGKDPQKDKAYALLQAKIH